MLFRSDFHTETDPSLKYDGAEPHQPEDRPAATDGDEHEKCRDGIDTASTGIYQEIPDAGIPGGIAAMEVGAADFGIIEPEVLMIDVQRMDGRGNQRSSQGKEHQSNPIDASAEAVSKCACKAHKHSV